MRKRRGADILIGGSDEDFGNFSFATEFILYTVLYIISIVWLVFELRAQLGKRVEEALTRKPPRRHPKYNKATPCGSQRSYRSGPAS